MRNNIIKKVEETGIIVIVRGVEREKLIPLAEAMYAGGVRLLEITYSANGSTPDEQTAENIAMLAKHFAGRMYIGAGTVLSERQVELTAAAGGGFIISPDTNPAVIKKARELDLVSMPGALTPTEIQTAHLAGADFIKLFPVDAFGPGYVKAVKAPLSHVKLLAVGGVNLENMESYRAAGAVGFGIGSGIVDKRLIDSGNFAEITRQAEAYAKAARG